MRVTVSVASHEAGKGDLALTEPADKTYQEWIAGTLDAVRKALADGHPGSANYDATTSSGP
jgi:hypothetical protein